VKGCKRTSKICDLPNLDKETSTLINNISLITAYFFLLSVQIRFQCDIERTVNKYKFNKLFLLTSCVLVCESDECRKTSI